jgi:hypothetical protein
VSETEAKADVEEADRAAAADADEVVAPVSRQYS